MSDETFWDEYPFRVLHTSTPTPVIRELQLSPEAATADTIDHLNRISDVLAR